MWGSFQIPILPVERNKQYVRQFPDLQFHDSVSVGSTLWTLPLGATRHLLIGRKLTQEVLK